MSNESDEPSEQVDDRPEPETTASLPVLLGALVLLVVGGLLSGGIVVALFEQDGAELGSAAVIFVLGTGMVVTAAFVILRRT